MSLSPCGNCLSCGSACGLELLLPHLAGVVVDQADQLPGLVCIWVRARSAGGTCPRCGMVSSRVHSRYERRLADAAAGGQRVVIRLRARRFFCSARDCPARTFAEQRLGRSVLSAPLPELAGVLDNHYDLIGAFDVIEHIDDDRAALASIAAKLKPGGKFVITVPAHAWMWSAHDVVNHHKRRYSKRRLRQLVEGSPLRLDSIGYFNSLLFPVAVAERLSSRLLRKDNADLTLPPAPLNATLERTFAAERHLIGRLPLPVGLSLFAVASAR